MLPQQTGREAMILKGSCHCGATKFEVSEVPETVTRCTCSICAKRGTLWAYYTPDKFALQTAPEAVAEYRWQSRSVSLGFCPICGCSTINKTPSWVDGKPDFDHPMIAVNARLFDDFDLDSIPIVVIDGKNLW
jgi:hypothetical protein